MNMQKNEEIDAIINRYSNKKHENQEFKPNFTYKPPSNSYTTYSPQATAVKSSENLENANKRNTFTLPYTSYTSLNNQPYKPQQSEPIKKSPNIPIPQNIQQNQSNSHQFTSNIQYNSNPNDQTSATLQHQLFNANNMLDDMSSSMQYSENNTSIQQNTKVFKNPFSQINNQTQNSQNKILISQEDLDKNNSSNIINKNGPSYSQYSQQQQQQFPQPSQSYQNNNELQQQNKYVPSQNSLNSIPQPQSTQFKPQIQIQQEVLQRNSYNPYAQNRGSDNNNRGVTFGYETDNQYKGTLIDYFKDNQQKTQQQQQQQQLPSYQNQLSIQKENQYPQQQQYELQQQQQQKQQQYVDPKEYDQKPNIFSDKSEQYYTTGRSSLKINQQNQQIMEYNNGTQIPTQGSQKNYTSFFPSPEKPFSNPNLDQNDVNTNKMINNFGYNNNPVQQPQFQQYQQQSQQQQDQYYLHNQTQGEELEQEDQLYNELNMLKDNIFGLLQTYKQQLKGRNSQDRKSVEEKQKRRQIRQSIQNQADTLSRQYINIQEKFEPKFQSISERSFIGASKHESYHSPERFRQQNSFDGNLTKKEVEITQFQSLIEEFLNKFKTMQENISSQQSSAQKLDQNPHQQSPYSQQDWQQQQQEQLQQYQSNQQLPGIKGKTQQMLDNMSHISSINVDTQVPHQFMTSNTSRQQLGMIPTQHMNTKGSNNTQQDLPYTPQKTLNTQQNTNPYMNTNLNTIQEDDQDLKISNVQSQSEHIKRGQHTNSQNSMNNLSYNNNPQIQKDQGMTTYICPLCDHHVNEYEFLDHVSTCQGLQNQYSPQKSPKKLQQQKLPSIQINSNQTLEDEGKNIQNHQQPIEKQNSQPKTKTNLDELYEQYRQNAQESFLLSRSGKKENNNFNESSQHGNFGGISKHSKHTSLLQETFYNLSDQNDVLQSLDKKMERIVEYIKQKTVPEMEPGKEPPKSFIILKEQVEDLQLAIQSKEPGLIQQVIFHLEKNLRKLEKQTNIDKGEKHTEMFLYISALQKILTQRNDTSFMIQDLSALNVSRNVQNPNLQYPREGNNDDILSGIEEGPEEDLQRISEKNQQKMTQSSQKYNTEQQNNSNMNKSNSVSNFTPQRTSTSKKNRPPIFQNNPLQQQQSQSQQHSKLQHGSTDRSSQQNQFIVQKANKFNENSLLTEDCDIVMSSTNRMDRNKQEQIQFPEPRQSAFVQFNDSQDYNQSPLDQGALLTQQSDKNRSNDPRFSSMSSQARQNRDPRYSAYQNNNSNNQQIQPRQSIRDPRYSQQKNQQQPQQVIDRSSNIETYFAPQTPFQEQEQQSQPQQNMVVIPHNQKIENQELENFVQQLQRKNNVNEKNNQPQNYSLQNIVNNNNNGQDMSHLSKNSQQQQQQKLQQQFQSNDQSLIPDELSARVGRPSNQPQQVQKSEVVQPSGNLHFNQKMKFMEIASQIKQGLPEGHPSHNYYVSALYNEAVNQGIPEKDWRYFIEDKFLQ